MPQFHHLLGPLFRDAGLPKGVFQILNFSEKDVAERVEQIIAHDDIRVSLPIDALEEIKLMTDGQFHRVYRTGETSCFFMRSIPKVRPTSYLLAER
jgi:hypothetical protein